MKILNQTLACGTFLLLFAGQAAPQQSWQAPRTEHGAPDLQGFWTSASITTLERDPALGEKLVVTAEEARALESANLLNQVTELDNAPSDPDRPPPTDGNTDAGYNAFWIDPGTRLARVGGEYRTSFIVEPADGRIPYTEAAGLAFLGYREQSGYDGPEQRPLGERCMVGFGSTGGPPMLPVLYNNTYQIVQNENYVMILVEMNHDARIIRLDGEPLNDGFAPWLGDSIGHWDGDTLVVETTNFHPQQSFRFAIKHTRCICRRRPESSNASPASPKTKCCTSSAWKTNPHTAAPGAPRYLSARAIKFTSTPATKAITPCPEYSPARGKKKWTAIECQ